MSKGFEPVGYMVANQPDGPWSFRKKESSGWFCERALYSEDQVRQLTEQRAELLEALRAHARAWRELEGEAGSELAFDRGQADACKRHASQIESLIANATQQRKEPAAEREVQ